MRKGVNFILLGVAVGLFIVGCATTQLQTKAVMTRTVVLNPTDKSSNRSIYLQVKNTAGSKINLDPILRKDFRDKGFTIVSNPKIAKYILNVNVLFANNIKEAYAIKAAAVSGVNTGLIAGVASGSAKNGLLVGAAAALVGGVIANATEDSIYRAVIDISVKEKKNNIKGDDINYNEDFVQQKTRILVSAVKMDLDLKKAIPILEEQASNQIVKIF